eukprot:TRINITY_DN721_c0_g1_i2.p1 TRINITY_DN721_c0_g1~~TRINITY_DN721_c0_g1_i2.p1  ORF type:complete len:579 (-),score=31.55 TRINITY_DN721_c0_g1_i2:584-2320(-)
MIRWEARRLLVWTVCWTVVFIFILSPLVGTASCFKWGFVGSTRSYILHGVHGQHRMYPPIGTHFGSGILLGIFLSVLFDPEGRFMASSRTHRSVRRYMASFSAECVFRLIVPWAWQFCAVSDTLLLWVPVLGHLAMFACSWLLLGLSIERLRLLSGDGTAVTTVRCLRVISTSAGVALLIVHHIPLSFNNLPIKGFFLMAFCLPYLGSHGLLIRAIRACLKEAIAETGDASRVATWAQWTTSAAATAAISTVAWAVCAVMPLPFPLVAEHWLFEFSYLIDRVSNGVLALLCADVFGHKTHRDRDTELVDLRTWLEERRKQLILEAVKEAARAISGPSLLLAALFDKADPDQLLVSAVERFRGVSWDVLKEHPQIIVEGGCLNVVGPGCGDLYNLSKPCKFSECDCFWSHSWQDDNTLKWHAMSQWCDEFSQRHGRAPVLWLDKVCIDQSNIQRDLACLPIFLAACNSFVMTCGTSYSSRLWCILELFVYVRILAEDRHRQAPVVLPLCEGYAEVAGVDEAWRSFDAASCECFVAEDKARIMEVIQQYPGGVSAFNAYIKVLVGDHVHNVLDDEKTMWI